MTRSIILSPEAVTEILTALHGCRSQLGDVANLAHAIKLMEEATEPEEMHNHALPNDPDIYGVDLASVDVNVSIDRTPQTHWRNGLTGLDGADEAQYLNPPDEDEVEEDMPPMPLMLDGDDDKSGGVATMAKDLLRGSKLGDRGRPKPKPYGAN